MSISLLKKTYTSISSNGLKLSFLNVIKTLNLRSHVVRMDTNHLCNLQCKTCYFSSLQTQREKEISLSDYHSIAKNVFPQTRVLFLSCYSEPFCSKNIITFIRIAKEQYKVPQVSLTTNANLLTKSLILELVDSNINEIVISLAGGTKETYEKTQVGASWEKLWTAIETINMIKKERRTEYPKIKINYIATKSSTREIIGLIPLLKQHDISELTLRELITFPNMDRNFFDKERLSEEDFGVLQDSQKVLREQNIPVDSSLQCSSTDKKRSISKKHPCILPHFQLYINAKGKLKFCLFKEWEYDILNCSLNDILKLKQAQLFFSQLKRSTTCTCIDSCSYYN